MNGKMQKTAKTKTWRGREGVSVRVCCKAICLDWKIEATAAAPDLPGLAVESVCICMVPDIRHVTSWRLQRR